MKEHIKKFPTVASADGHVIDAPFVASVVPATEGAAPLNIHCAQEGKKLKVEGGQISIVDNLISFMIMGDSFTAEPGMNWTAWLQSEYGKYGEAQELVIISNSGNLLHIGNGMPIYEMSSGTMQYQDDVIINEANYNCYGIVPLPPIPGGPGGGGND